MLKIRKMMKMGALLQFVILVLPIQASEVDLGKIVNQAKYIFCIDGGGSETSLTILDSHLETVKVEKENNIGSMVIKGPTNINVAGIEEAVSNLSSLFRDLKIIEAEDQRRGIAEIASESAIVCGLAGLGRNEEGISAVRKVFIDLGFSSSKVALLSDAAMGAQIISTNQQILLIAGTGSICLTLHKRIGGYGYILGDEGSGFYIGKLALREALNAEHGETEPFILTSKLCEIFAIDSILEAVPGVYTTKTLPPYKIAKACPFVFEGAYHSNNKRCCHIISQTTTELADLIKRAYKAEKMEGDKIAVYLWGGVFKNHYFADFLEEIKDKVGDKEKFNYINIAHENISLLAIKEAQRKLLKQEP